MLAHLILLKMTIGGRLVPEKTRDMPLRTDERKKLMSTSAKRRGVRPRHQSPAPRPSSHMPCGSKIITMPADGPVSIVDGQPKRVILRLRYGDFDDDDNSHTQAVEAHVTAIGRTMDEFTLHRRHVLHVEMRQDYMKDKPNASFHVTLDIEKDA
jgi:hypothetical protein